MPAVAYVNSNYFIAVLSIQGSGDNASATIHDTNSTKEKVIPQELLLRMFSPFPPPGCSTGWRALGFVRRWLGHERNALRTLVLLIACDFALGGEVPNAKSRPFSNALWPDQRKTNGA